MLKMMARGQGLRGGSTSGDRQGTGAALSGAARGHAIRTPLPEGQPQAAQPSR